MTACCYTDTLQFRRSVWESSTVWTGARLVSPGQMDTEIRRRMEEVSDARSPIHYAFRTTMLRFF